MFPEPLQGLDNGRWFKNTTFALLLVYDCKTEQKEMNNSKKSLYTPWNMLKKHSILTATYLNKTTVQQFLSIIQLDNIMVHIPPYLQRKPTNLLHSSGPTHVYEQIDSLYIYLQETVTGMRDYAVRANGLTAIQAKNVLFVLLSVLVRYAGVEELLRQQRR